MNEKEIEGLLSDAAIETRSIMPCIEYRRFAAHAIAEKMAEGVVVEARGVIRTTHEGHYALTIEHTYQGSGIGWATNAGSDVLDILRGDDNYESVTVTVTKEE